MNTKKFQKLEKPVPTELTDDALDKVSGGEKSFHAVPALNQCPVCGALYPMNDICPNCVREAPAIEQ